ncbi:MAG: hypothetical protein KatS3mg003_1925 [Candidatus Nitrosocaldaceae archaeon]|nr:MAG: hypothetical protein KatS3mg003_1925 [Candidatus Nitrosocaldaceae archaeon]
MNNQVYIKPSKLFRFISPILKPYARRVEYTFKRYRSNKGRKYYPCMNMIFLAIWMSLSNKGQRATDRNLRVNDRLALELGFKDNTPKQPTISRFVDRMGKAGIAMAMRLLVIHLVERGIINKKHLVIDSTYLKQYCKNDNDAKIGYSKKYGFYKGYKIHIIVDADTELPIVMEVTPANIHDSKVFKRLFVRVNGYSIIEADSAYDSREIRDYIIDNNAIPLIDYNPRRGKKRKKISIKRYTVEHCNSRILDLLSSIYRVKGLFKTKVYAYLSAIALLAISIVADAMNVRDMIRCYKRLIVSIGVFWMSLLRILDNYIFEDILFFLLYVGIIIYI